MNAINNAVTSYNKFLTAGSDYLTFLKEAAAKLNGTQCSKLLGELAQAHAKHYKCEARQTNRGTWGFYKAGGDDRDDAARMHFARNVLVHFTTSTPKPKTRKQVDPIVSLAARLQKQLDKRELARLVKLLATS